MEIRSILCMFGLFLMLLVTIFAIVLICRRTRARRKIRNMSSEDKWEMLSSLTEPYGFVYEPTEDIFVSHLNAWQKEHGYMALFDTLAEKFNMIFDAYPVYFDYADKTWLIEFWKGQYGINTGAEVGIYHSNRRIPKEQRKLIQYNAVSEEEMPLIGMCLEKKEEKLFSRKRYHWWLAAFRMGIFSEPKDLQMYVHLSFSDMEMAEAFCKGLEEAGFSEDKYRLRYQRVSVVLDETKEHFGIRLVHRGVVQSINQLYCNVYRLFTRPYIHTADRMLYLYMQLPWCFRHMVRLHAFGRKHK